MRKGVYIFLTILFFILFILAAIVPAISNDKWYVSLFLAVGAGIDAGLFLIPFYRLIAEQNKIRKKLAVYAFTDRDVELKQVCEYLLGWANGEEIKPICVSCSTNASGKTYFLLKIWNTVISKNEFYKVLGLDWWKFTNFKSWLRVKNIVFINCRERTDALTEKLISKINYNSSKRNKVFIFDNLTEEFYESVIRRFDLIKYIYSLDSTFEDADNIIRNNITLTRFEINDVITYYSKIKKVENKLKTGTNPFLCKSCFGVDLKRSDFDKIIYLTQGNIKYISKIFDARKNIENILKFDENDDENKKFLNEIDFKLLIGDYNTALILLDNNREKFSNTYLPYQFRYKILYAHCLHLLNRYEDAIFELSTLLTITNPPKIDDAYSDLNSDHIIELRLAHYKKHLGDFDGALEILKFINSPQAILDRLGITAADYFLTGEKKYAFLADYEELQKLLNGDKLSCEQKIKFLRYSPVYNFLKIGNLQDDQLNDCIKEYTNSKDHLLANALFMKAEIYRLKQAWSKAKPLYLQCLDYSYTFNDENLKQQVSMMINYLVGGKKIKLKTSEAKHVLNYVEIKHFAITHNMQYNYDCACMFNSIELDDPDKEEKQNKVDSRIFVIL